MEQKIYPNVHIGKNAVIEEYVVIGVPPRGTKAGELPTIIGDDAVIRSHTVIYAGNRIGKGFQTGHHALVREENEIGDHVSIGSSSVVEHHVKMGNNVRIHSQAFVPELSILDRPERGHYERRLPPLPQREERAQGRHGQEECENRSQRHTPARHYDRRKCPRRRRRRRDQGCPSEQGGCGKSRQDNQRYFQASVRGGSMKIPLVDLKAQYAGIKSEIDGAMQRVFDETDFINGSEVAEFEKSFAAFCGIESVIGVGNGTDALQIALQACGIGRGDEVITAVNTFIATSEGISAAGARPVFVDNDPQTYTIDVRKIEEKITPRTKAIIPVHLYGQPAAMDAVGEIAARNNLTVIEDAAQAHGARFKGTTVGNFGRLACFSFYPGKNLGAYGDAGAIATNDEVLAHKVRMLANHGRLKKYEHEMEGYNSRLDTLQAAILLVKLRHLGAWTEKRQRHAALYTKLLSSAPEIITPAVQPDATHVFHLYVVRVQQRDRVQQMLKDAGIATGIHYPIPLHLQPAYRHFGLPAGTFPVAERFAGEVLSLPMYPELTEEQIGFIAETLIKACRSKTVSKSI
jgi:dTDP-4-amino-4,6-dideoxygalactose transaminase/carbonic anhydrase/acetyltransferase-like protein (isoleucine patch superfamily)